MSAPPQSEQGLPHPRPAGPARHFPRLAPGPRFSGGCTRARPGLSRPGGGVVTASTPPRWRALNPQQHMKRQTRGTLGRPCECSGHEPQGWGSPGAPFPLGRHLKQGPGRTRRAVSAASCTRSPVYQRRGLWMTWVTDAGSGLVGRNPTESVSRLAAEIDRASRAAPFDLRDGPARRVSKLVVGRGHKE